MFEVDDIEDHLDHIDKLEIYTERTNSGVTRRIYVECTECGVPVHLIHEVDIHPCQSWTVYLKLEGMEINHLGDEAKPGDPIEVQLETCDKNFTAEITGIENARAELFVCGRCGKNISWDKGCDDERPTWCDDCWSEEHQDRKAVDTPIPPTSIQKIVEETRRLRDLGFDADQIDATIERALNATSETTREERDIRAGVTEGQTGEQHLGTEAGEGTQREQEALPGVGIRPGCAGLPPVAQVGEVEESTPCLDRIGDETTK